MTHRVAVFGGSFNPPHIAHVLVATFVLTMHDIDQVLVVPCFRHPFAKPLVEFEHRLAMCERAFACLARVEVSEVERELGGESRTVRTLEHLARSHPGWSLRLVIGADVVAETPRWHGFERIRELAPPIVVARRGRDPGASAEGGGVFPAVSSSEIREAFASGDEALVRAWVPPAVRSYASQHGLYAGPSADA